MKNWLISSVVLLIYLILIRSPVLYLILEELKYIFSIFLVVLVRLPNKLNNFLFQCHFNFHANSTQFNIDIVKINFMIMYLSGVA